ncbi:gas vesicle protein GvpG [Streptomyces tsukubensis]|uniref:Gas vesicle protein n=1 Tax=Streptomyces tsukubensis TaxID=83656 RepID=A0A1V4AEY3_9ACTN|nr:gas vesicle protein GvpG [Streptomyces tsukubensis]OON82664.1 gas vesicle protein [Streptomyces tsukubensis]QFR92167.1 gas vesicle protein [Streptomyces tsukubensis]
MGLISGLLTLPLAPVRGVGWIAGQLEQMGAREMYDPAVLRTRLSVLNDSLERGEITDEQFEREEEHLLDLLEGSKESLPVERTT